MANSAHSKAVYGCFVETPVPYPQDYMDFLKKLLICLNNLLFNISNLHVSVNSTKTAKN